MSLSINPSRSHNPFAQLQSLLQQGSSQSSTATQSDPLSQLISALDQQSSAASTSATGTAPSTATSGNTPQFGPQMLQALFAMQAHDSQSLMSQFSAPTNSSVATDLTPQGQQSRQADGGGQTPLDMLLSPQAGTSQTVANSNGSSTTTIAYNDGSSVAMTTPANGSGSSASSITAGGSNVAGNNLLEQLIQMQAQLLNTATPQSIMTV